MRSPALAALIPLVAAALLSACGDEAPLRVSAGTGPHPELPPPHPTLLPTVNIAPAKGWPAGAAPTAAPGLRVAAFADALDHPRWLLGLPNADALLAQTNAPTPPEHAAGTKDW